MGYAGLNDRAFDRALSLREAYTIMERFIVHYNARGESTTVALVSDVGTSSDWTPSHPAQIYDFLRVAGAVLSDESLTRAGDGAGAA